MVQAVRRDVISALAGISASGLLVGSGAVAQAVRNVGARAGLGYRGVVYDVGLRFEPSKLSVDPFDSKLVAYDLRVIAKIMQANAVRIEGEDIDRLVTASRIAHENGLKVFFNPWKMNVGAEESRAYFAQAAAAAEQLRKDGLDLVFVAGCEYSIFNDGIYAGSSIMERINSLIAERTKPKPGSEKETAAKLNAALGSFVKVIRKTFNGPITYAATTFEEVDWSIFDLIGIDHYRGAESEAQYLAVLDKYPKNKPIVVMEVGSCAYKGAAARGGAGFMVLKGVNPDGTGNFEGGVVPTRSESEQADYVETQLRLLSGAGIAGAFIYVFSFPSYRFGQGARDLDMVSYSLVKTYPATDPRSQLIPPWAPKEAFHRTAAIFGRLAQGAGSGA